MTRTIVTRYPTGCFGINHNGHDFYWWGFDESEVHKQLVKLKVPKRLVTWEERYYRDGRYIVPSDYMTRPYTPKKLPK